jgi:hypothetical protein
MTLRHVQYDSIDTLRCMEYSEREATFLYTVALYSGYFLRRQFNSSVQRRRGWIAANFLAKAKRAGHVREIQCAPRRLLYQLCAKQIYRIVGQKNSQNRRPKSPREIRRRLIMLDYVLAHLGKQDFLETDASRRKFFAQFGAKDDALVSANKFGDLMPVSVRRAERSLTVLFAFIDEGQRSIARFERFLSTHDKLLCSLPAFEVVYVATTPELFKEAQHLFRRLFPARPVTHLKNVPMIGGQISPIIPKAELIVELVADCYPSFLESDPVCDAVWFRERLGEQKSLFSSEIPNDAV